MFFFYFFWLRAGLGTRNGSREVGQPATGVAISIGLGFGISAFSFWPLARVYRTFQLSYKTHAQAQCTLGQWVYSTGDYVNTCSRQNVVSRQFASEIP